MIPVISNWGLVFFQASLTKKGKESLTVLNFICSMQYFLKLNISYRINCLLYPNFDSSHATVQLVMAIILVLKLDINYFPHQKVIETIHEASLNRESCFYSCGTTVVISYNMNYSVWRDEID